MRLVLDTNVLVAAMRSPSGASAALVRAALGGRFELVAGQALFSEYEAVMTRPEHVTASGTSVGEVHGVLQDLAASVVPAGRSFSWRPQLSDPDDEMVLEAAINGRADAIVTFEVSTFAGPARRFGIETLTPAAAWRMLIP